MATNGNQASAGSTATKPARLPAPLRYIAEPLARLSVSRFNLRVGLTSDSSISIVLIVAGVWYGRMHAGYAALTVILGLFAFTFLEYAAHRWLFHGNTGPFREGHDHHHDNPLGYDALPFFIPPLFMCLLAAIFSTVLPLGYALLLAGVIAAGYATYGLSHVAIHAHHFNSRLLRRWVWFHNIHHYHPDKNFGVTTGLWDYLLGTHYKRRQPHLAHARR